MTDTTKPDLSRQMVERLAERIKSNSYGWCDIKDTNATMLLALLDAKEAAERERDDWHRYHYTVSNQLTEASASAAAAWEGLPKPLETDDAKNLKRDSGIPHTPTQLTMECRQALSGEGPRSYDWSDKPHRLVFDLCREIERIAAIAYAAKEAAHG